MKNDEVKTKFFVIISILVITIILIFYYSKEYISPTTTKTTTTTAMTTSTSTTSTILEEHVSQRMKPCVKICTDMGAVQAQITTFDIHCLCTMSDGSIKIGW